RVFSDWINRPITPPMNGKKNSIKSHQNCMLQK
ncbi:MAG: hypothetical protein ACI80H_001134, partial [Pseudoalteromonas distincta]